MGGVARWSERRGSGVGAVVVQRIELSIPPFAALKRMGYSCDIAEDGFIAAEKAQKKPYDLILSVELLSSPFSRY